MDPRTWRVFVFRFFVRFVFFVVRLAGLKSSTASRCGAACNFAAPRAQRSISCDRSPISN
jgi:hypothetical protein